MAVVAGDDRGARHAHDRRVLAAIRAHRDELVALQAIDASVAPGCRGRAKPGLAAPRALRTELGHRIGHGTADRLTSRTGGSTPSERRQRCMAARPRRAMKNPSVPSRCGSSWRRRSALKSPCSRRKRVDHLLALGAGDRAHRVHERAARGQRLRPGGEDPRLERRELADRLGAGPPAQIRPGLQRPEPAARRVDQHPVERPVGPRDRGVADLDPHARGAHPRAACARAPRPGRGGARPRRPRPGPPSAPPDAWSCRRGRRTDRARARPGAARGSARRASRRATGAGPRPLAHSSEPWTSNGPSSTSPSGRSGARAGSAPAARPRPPRRVATSGLTRSADSAGSLITAQQRPRLLGAELVPPLAGQPARHRVEHRRGLRRVVVQPLEDRRAFPRRRAGGRR